MVDKIRELRRRHREKVALHQSYQNVFTTPDGERVLRHLMKSGFVLSSTFVKGDPYATALNEGSRRLALSILRFVHKDHSALIEAIEQELQNAEQQNIP